MKYVSFWIPTLITKETFIPQIKHVTGRNISDDPFGSHNVDLCIEDNLNFKVTFDNNDVVDFCLVKQHCRGFLIYRIEGTSLDEWILASIKHPVYHLFKELFHEHEFHDGRQDSLLFAYIFDDDNENIEEFIKNSFEHYISIYYRKCIAYQNTVRALIDSSRDEEETIFDSFFKFQRLSRTQRKILKFFGEFVYFQALSAEQKGHIRYSDCFLVKDYLKAKLSLMKNTSEYVSFNLGLLLACCGVLLTFIGVVATFCSFF